MLKKIILKNFESHEYTSIDFSSGVNVISGNSNSGKSSLFRAIRWVLYNEPGGEDFINFNATEAYVAIYVKEHIIERIKARNNKKNEYILDGKTLKAFGQSVPKEVQDIFAIDVTNSEWQFDKRPFLIAETGGFIASKMNEIVNLELIDYSLKNVNNMKLQSTKKLETCKELIREAENKINCYDWLQKTIHQFDYIQKEYAIYQKQYKTSIDMQTLYSDIEIIKNKINEINIVNIDSIASHISEFSTINIFLSQMENNLSEIEYTKNLIRSINSYQEVAVSSVFELVRHYKEIVDSIISIDIIVNEFNGIENQKTIIKELSDRRITATEDKIKELNAMSKNANVCNDVYSSIVSCNEDIFSLKKNIDMLHNEYKNIAPDTCPLCGAEFNKELE